MAETMGTLEASEKWGYSQATIRKWCAAGLIKGSKTRQRRQPLAYSKRRKMSETNKKEIKEEVNL